METLTEQSAPPASEGKVGGSRLNDILNQPTAKKPAPQFGGTGPAAPVIDAGHPEPVEGSKAGTTFSTLSKPVIKTPPPKPAAETTEPGAPAKPPLTERQLRTSAKSTRATIDMVQEMLFTPLENYKFKGKIEKRFGSLEKAQEVLGWVEEEDTREDEAEKKLYARMNRMNKKHLEQIAAIPFNKEERDDLDDALYNYYEIKQTEFSPEVMLALALVKSLGTRCVDIIVS